jgi:hypothetical protein
MHAGIRRSASFDDSELRVEVIAVLNPAVAGFDPFDDEMIGNITRHVLPAAVLSS